MHPNHGRSRRNEKHAENRLFLGIFLAALAAGAIPSEAQLASPAAKAACKFADGKTITVNYSSPRMRGRKIFGDLVPFGEVWRAGRTTRRPLSRMWM